MWCDFKNVQYCTKRSHSLSEYPSTVRLCSARTFTVSNERSWTHVSHMGCWIDFLRGSSQWGERSASRVSDGDVWCGRFCVEAAHHTFRHPLILNSSCCNFSQNNPSMCRGNTHVRSRRDAASSEMSKPSHSDNKCLRKYGLCLLFLPVSVRRTPQGRGHVIKTSKAKL